MLGFQNCSPKTSFTNSSTVPVSATSASDPGVDIGQTPAPTSVSEVLPQFKFSIDKCKAGEMCRVQVTLNKKASADFMFDWKTNDSIYLTDSQYARPGYHYEPANGVVLIKAGEQVSYFQIKSINWSFTGSMDQTIIALTYWKCIYNSKEYNCSQFYNP